ncbi:MAG: M3 family metallopeptidase, partial [Nanoarchaeota archaeon]
MKEHQLSAWDLSEIRPSSLQKTFQEIESLAKNIERWRPKLKHSLSSQVFLSLLAELEKLQILNCKVGVYAQLRFAEDSSNQEASALQSQVENFLTNISNRLLFFNLWFKQLPEPEARRLISDSGKYHYFLEKMYKSKPYILDEKEEKIVNIKDVTGVSALNSIYNILCSQFQFEFEGKKIGQEELLAAVRSASPQRRAAAYRALLGKYRSHKDLIGEVYRNIVNDWREENIRLRGYDSPIHVRNVGNDIPDKAVEALLKACERNELLFQRFFELKRKKLGLKKMRRFDLYAPLQKKKEPEIPYHEAVTTVLETFQDFSRDFYREASNIITADHIHSKVQKNKDTGAFCCSVTSKLNPYVLLNYTGTLRDVSTLAHELGHGIHHNLARGQTEFTFHAPLPLAETASIFSEMVLSERLLKKYPGRARELLFT